MKETTTAPGLAAQHETDGKRESLRSSEPEHRSGFVALLGRPNVGKSTLLNRFIGEKLAITSPKPQTTRTRILGIMSDPDCQIAFLDTPGVHKPKGPLNQYMVDTALSAIDEVDAVLFVVEASLGKANGTDLGETAQEIVQRIKAAGKPVVVAINKIDLIPKPILLPLIQKCAELLPGAEIVPVSARDGEGLSDLIQCLKALMPVSPALFPEDMLTDQAERAIVSELIREQVLRHCRAEIPYSTAVDIDHFDESEREPIFPVKPGALGGLVRIAATIYVERDSQKAIVIGKGGKMLKEIGASSRQSIERFLGTHVYLSLLVKVESRWSERADALRRFGYRNEGKF